MRSILDTFGGCVDSLHRYGSLAGEPYTVVLAAKYARCSSDPMGTGQSGLQRRGTGSGSGFCIEDAIMPALGEVLERNGASCVDSQRLFTATAAELGSYALDLSCLPHCSDREYANPKCRLSKPSPQLAVRWIEGVSLHSGKKVAIPYSLAYLYAGATVPQERLQSPISTGLASHSNLVDALLSGLLEVIERDALSIMWLQKLPGTLIDISTLDMTRVEWIMGRSSRLEYFFFDIQTELQIPVVCCIRRASDSVVAHTLVSCAAGFDMSALVSKTARDICAHSIGFRHSRPIPRDWEDFNQMSHGATYMAAKQCSPAFDFMLSPDPSANDDHRGKLSNRAELRTSLAQLKYSLDELSKAHCEAFAVDLTTVESASVGVHVVRVIVPGLQPLPYVYSARYLAHDRLYKTPQKMGRAAYPENNINPWPIPFS